MDYLYSGIYIVLQILLFEDPQRRLVRMRTALNCEINKNNFSQSIFSLQTIYQFLQKTLGSSTQLRFMELSPGNLVDFAATARQIYSSYKAIKTAGLKLELRLLKCEYMLFTQKEVPLNHNLVCACSSRTSICIYTLKIIKNMNT